MFHRDDTHGAFWRDAVGVEPFCGAKIGFEQKRSLSQERSLQKGGLGEMCGFWKLCGLATIASR
jgi:hypothetical protein